MDNDTHVETVALLTCKKDVERIDIEMTVDKEDVLYDSRVFFG